MGERFPDGSGAFTEHKEVTSELKQPLKISAKPYHGKETGHMIEVTMNLAWTDIDGMKDKDAPIVHMISNMIDLINGPMGSKYLGMSKDIND